MLRWLTVALRWFTDTFADLQTCSSDSQFGGSLRVADKRANNKSEFLTRLVASSADVAGWALVRQRLYHDDPERDGSERSAGALGAGKRWPKRSVSKDA